MAGACDNRGVFVVVNLEQLGNSEVQQLGLSRGRNQYVAGFEVAVHDQQPVGVGHGPANLGEQPKARVDVERIALRVGQQVATIDVFHCDIRLAVVGRAAFVEGRDVRVLERAKNAAFDAEAPHHVRVVARGAQHLECHAPMDVGVEVLAKVDTAHAAVAKGLQHLVGAYLRRVLGRANAADSLGNDGWREGTVRCGERVWVFVMLRKQRTQCRRDARITRFELLEPLLARARVEYPQAFKRFGKASKRAWRAILRLGSWWLRFQRHEF